MNVIILISMIICGISGVFSLTRQYQMLQQNSYYPSRYASWVRNSYSVNVAVTAILFCASSVLYSAEKYILQLFFVCLLLIVRAFCAVRAQKKSIKKLVFTSRIKRLYITAIVINVILIFIYCIAHKLLIGEICVVLLFMLSIVSTILVFLCWILTYPVESAIAKWYINDAKKMLRSKPSLRVIGVTGSYGKTTTKFILNRILSEQFNTIVTPGSFNTPMGVVRTVRNLLKHNTQIFICEMGAKNIGDIKEICDIAHPSYGIITSVGEQHLETFKTVNNVYKTKFELDEEVRKNGGITFVNGDSKEINSRIDKSKYNVYGTDSSYPYYAENITYSRNGSTFDLSLKGEKLTVTTKLLGLHSVNDIVGAAAVAYDLGVGADSIKYAIATLKPTEHRLELKSGINGSLIIDDAYNANPEGCLEAVKVLGSFNGMKKVLITPGLIELGSREYDCNYKLGEEASKYCDVIILVGKNRSKPMCDALETQGYDKENIFVVSSFKEAMQVYSPIAGSNTIALIENDLPDNYLN